eukprot:3148476-Prymnesium_polylepis.1
MPTRVVISPSQRSWSSTLTRPIHRVAVLAKGGKCYARSASFVLAALGVAHGSERMLSPVSRSIRQRRCLGPGTGAPDPQDVRPANA